MHSKGIIEAIFVQDLPRPLKLTFLYFAKFAKPDGSEVRPGIERAAADLHCNEKTIRRDLKKLIDGGWLVPDGKHRYVDRFKVNLEQLGIQAEAPAKRLHATHLEPAPPAPDLPTIREEPPEQITEEVRMLRNMRKTEQRIISYMKLKKAGSSSAEISKPSIETVRAFHQQFKSMELAMDPKAREFELAASYASLLLSEARVLT